MAPECFSPFRYLHEPLWLLPTEATTVGWDSHPQGKRAFHGARIIPRYTGTLVHDCWASDFAYDQCRHQLCGSHLLRELTFVVESNGFRWARLMKTLLREACHRVNRSATKVLAEAERLAVRKRYRTILTQGGKELPEIPPRQKGKRGRVAKSDAHNLHERLAKHEESVLRFMGDPDVSFTNNTGEQKIRMAKVTIKVSGCFRTRLYAEAWCRISSYLSSMAALGYNPLVAIQIALAGKARRHDQDALRSAQNQQGVSSYNLPSIVIIPAKAARIESQIGTSTHSPGAILSMAATIPSTRASMRGQEVDISTSTDSRRASRFC